MRFLDRCAWVITGGMGRGGSNTRRSSFFFLDGHKTPSM